MLLVAMMGNCESGLEFLTKETKFLNLRGCVAELHGASRDPKSSLALAGTSRTLRTVQKQLSWPCIKQVSKPK